MDKSSKDKEYNIKFNIEDTKLLIKANNQEEEYITLSPTVISVLSHIPL